MSLQLPPIFATLQVPLILLTNIATLAIGPRHRVLQFAFSVPVLGVLVAQSVYREWDRGWGLQYGLNCFVMSAVMTWVDWVLLDSPDRERWVRVKSNGQVESNGHAVISSKMASAPTGFWSRLWWAAQLSTTNRYTGWSCESKNVPVEVGPEYPRLLFIVRKTLRAGLFYVLKDAVYSYTASSPHGTWLEIAHLDPVISFVQYPFLYRLKFTLVYIVLTYTSLELMNTLYGIVSVATGLAAPMNCPSMFGDLKGLYSVRRAWSVVWHQGVRRVCSAPGIYLARDVLRLRKGSFTSKYVQLFAGFGVSAVMHGVASMLCHASLNDDQAFEVFLFQAIIIFVEDHLIEFGKKCGFRDGMFWRLVGFGWTVLAIGASFERWTGQILGHGIWVHDREVDLFGIGPK
ncbi:membrane bound O-acyl transferase family-domain-containing protein [Boeremia exigua]|uniref:membrane bound O-acyl transferase family-domain-containing protein n=1 Tax=Boeremia exigua TaxID=749465 RepID=UPI001E8DB4FD|nr:membrane bound O-acyl transferase family-domain-containing protein [Boeremia exigua]KAH6618760.1 membrane bound O-acyl transferase family-domain-containing protein [Boeremia exigua]